MADRFSRIEHVLFKGPIIPEIARVGQRSQECYLSQFIIRPRIQQPIQDWGTAFMLVDKR
ncbi:hypothetical protein [Spirosoma sp.]|uniref:hypothetical protein n=1 Tax=Spirosoma sp. TaxID=1899569 RepID=UPI0026016FE0|nr:hypothetical protein [Spirosoma sp.]MCX6215876.1 hypothetical protein [Spirosoma sp.]